MNLEEYLNKRTKGLLIKEIKELLIDLNKGFKVMNEYKIIHEDIKPINILLLLNKNNLNKVCFIISDFRLSNFYRDWGLTQSPIFIVFND